MIVRLICAQCDTRLGTFENEWIRLTSSYARPKQPGRHFMTEIGNRVQQVPTGASQKAAEGCGMAEVFCKVCSCLVGQYCKTAPNQEKQGLVNNYFYKFSKTYLIDADSLESAEPVFTYGGDLAMAYLSAPPPPRSSMPTRTRSRDLQSRRSLDQHPRAQSRERAFLPERLSPVERRRVSEHQLGGFSQSDSSLERLGAQQKGEENGVVNDQQKQITALSNQIDSLKSTVHDLSSLVHKICAERQEPGVQMSTPTHSATKNRTPSKNSQAQSDELQRLRMENEQLRQRFAMIESVMGVKPDIRRGLGQWQGSRPSNGLPSEDQLPTPSASQQSSFEIKPREPVSLQQAASEARQEGEPIQQTDVPQENMRYDDDVHPGEDTEMQLGSEPSAEPCSDTPGLNSSTLESPTPNGEQTLSTADRSSSALSCGNSEHTMVPTQDPVAVPSEAKAGTRRQGRVSTESRALLQYSPHQPLFGVIKPVKKVQKVKQSANAHLPQLNLPELPGSRPYPVAAPRFHETELVEFSDDENPVPSKDAIIVESLTDQQLHYGPSLSGPPRAPGVSPWIPRDPIAVDPTTTVATADLNSSSRPSSSGPGSADLQIQITGPQQVRDRLERGESPFGDIKEPKDKRITLQTTERLLNEELMELGMEEWIGKDKNTKAYRQIIGKARAERRERKKQEALAKAGVVCVTGLAPPHPKPPVVSETTRRNPGRPPKKHLTLRKPRSTKRQPKPLAEMANEHITNRPGPNSSKRKAAVLDHSDVEVMSEEAPETGSPPTRQAATRKSSKFWPQQLSPGEDMSEPVRTRRQTRAAEIDKLEPRAPEVVEAEVES
ncbi:hypothetical protein DV736_g6260, partial [Chaetothyriales sp. CBS 134916]